MLKSRLDLRRVAAACRAEREVTDVISNSSVHSLSGVKPENQTRGNNVMRGKLLAAFCFLFPLWGLGGLYAQHPPLGGGNGTSGTPYLISDTSHLRILADYVNAGNGNATSGVYYILMNNLDLVGYANWDPIGNNSVANNTHRFQGNFDGNNKVISNLKINRPTANYVGLFGLIAGTCQIANLGVEIANSSSVTGGNYTGGLAGYANNSGITISNCYVTGNVNGVQYVGGLIGRKYGGSITNCYATGNVIANGSSSSANVGGLVGYTNYRASISYCYATGNISGSGFSGTGGLVGNALDTVSISNCYATGNVNGPKYVGGLVGSKYGGSITNCYATGNVTGGGSHVGGLVGYNNNSTISNCCANGTIIGYGENIGGLVGYNDYSNIIDCYSSCDVTIYSSNYGGGLVGYNINSVIENCYATGSINGYALVGGLVGNNVKSIINNCYATNNVSGSYVCVGGLVGINGNQSTISNCYATGNVVGVSMCVGGLAGENNKSTIKNCVAANDSVIMLGSMSSIDRISGHTYDCWHQNNYAINTMVVRNDNGNIQITDWGSGMSRPLDSLMSLAFYTNVGNWRNNTAWSIDSANAIWDICDSISLPWLRWQNISCIPIVYDTIIATAGANGNINPSGTVIVEEGEDQTFTFSADNGYEVDELLVDGVNVPDSIAGGSYTFVNVTANHTISVSFKAIATTHTITATAGSNGSISPSGAVNVTEGGEQTFTFTADNGYEIDQVLIDNINYPSAVANGFYTFSNVTANHSIHVTFSLLGAVKYTITASAGANGTITPNGTISVTEGNNQAFTFTANSNYEIDQVLIDNVNNPAAVTAGSYTFVNVTANHSIAVSFKETVGIVTITNDELRITIYPNPTDGKLTIRNEESEVRNVEIYDIYGKNLTPLTSHPSPLILDISHLANGMYFLKVDGKVFKVIKSSE